MENHFNLKLTERELMLLVCASDTLACTYKKTIMSFSGVLKQTGMLDVFQGTFEEISKLTDRLLDIKEGKINE